MKFEEINEWDRYPFEVICACQKVHTVFTQEDSFPEYHTHIYIKCSCGEYIEFNLPVN